MFDTRIFHAHISSNCARGRYDDDVSTVCNSFNDTIVLHTDISKIKDQNILTQKPHTNLDLKYKVQIDVLELKFSWKPNSTLGNGTTYPLTI